jgi:hypothetical protein
MYPQPGFRSSKKTYVDTGCSVTNRVEANTQQEVKIEKLEKIYCDDFVCTSSPSVELAVRSFARELELLKMSPRLFSKDVVFGDGVRSFKGNSRYSRMRWISENVRKPEVVRGGGGGMLRTSLRFMKLNQLCRVVLLIFSPYLKMQVIERLQMLSQEMARVRLLYLADSFPYTKALDLRIRHYSEALC